MSVQPIGEDNGMLEWGYETVPDVRCVLDGGAVGVEIPAETMKKVDEILGSAVVTDPSLTKSPNPRPTGQ